jgi:hypothetical protein
MKNMMIYIKQQSEKNKSKNGIESGKLTLSKKIILNGRICFQIGSARNISLF